MRIVKRIAAAVVLLAVFVVGFAYVLPSNYHVTRSIDIAAPPSTIYPLVADVRAWKRWSAWNRRDPAMTIVYAGPTTGAGAQWRWTSKSEGNGIMTFTGAQPDRRLDYALEFPDFDSHARGAITFDPIAPSTTRVTWTNDGELGNNPMMRWMGLAMDRMVGNDFATGLANLKDIAAP